MHPFLIARYLSFVLIILINLGITIFAAWHFTGLPVNSGDLSIVDPYLVVVSAMTVFFLPPILAVDISRRNALPSKAWFEMTWLLLLWLLELGGGVRLTINGQYFSCTTPFQTCTAPKILVALVWSSDTILLAHLLAVMVLTATTPRKPDSTNPLWITIRAHPCFQPPGASFSIIEPNESKPASTKLSKRRGSEILTLNDGERDTAFFGNESAEGYSPVGPSLFTINTTTDASSLSNEGRRQRTSSQSDNWRYSHQQYSKASFDVPPVPPLPPMFQGQSRLSVSTARQSIIPPGRVPFPQSTNASRGPSQAYLQQEGQQGYRPAHNAGSFYANLPSMVGPGGPLYSTNNSQVSVPQLPGAAMIQHPRMFTTSLPSQRSQRPARAGAPPSLSISTTSAPMNKLDRTPSTPTSSSVLRISAPLTSLPAFPASAAKRISVHHAQSQRRVPSMIQLPAPLQAQRDTHGQQAWLPSDLPARDSRRVSRPFPVISRPQPQPFQQVYGAPLPPTPAAGPWNVNIRTTILPTPAPPNLVDRRLSTRDLTGSELYAKYMADRHRPRASGDLVHGRIFLVGQGL